MTLAELRDYLVHAGAVREARRIRARGDYIPQFDEYRQARTPAAPQDTSDVGEIMSATEQDTLATPDPSQPTIPGDTLIYLALLRAQATKKQGATK